MYACVFTVPPDALRACVFTVPPDPLSARGAGGPTRKKRPISRSDHVTVGGKAEHELPFTCDGFPGWVGCIGTHGTNTVDSIQP